MEALDTDFKKSVFDAALKSFEQSDNPLRLNNLATGLRELIRLVLRDLAPEAGIKACSWYKPEVDKNGNEMITRSQRIHYAVHAGLPIDFVQDTLHVDIKKTTKDFNTLNGTFSKFTHIEEATFGIDDWKADQFAEEALEIFSSLYETIEDCRASTYRAMEEYAKDAVEDELFSSVISELDQLATHYTVSQVNMEDLDLTMDSDRIKLAIAGTVDCDFQYGSSFDVERGDGAESSGAYPFTCKYEADIKTPSDLGLVFDSLKIDNSSFYE
jgi:hypothetical protein